MNATNEPWTWNKIQGDGHPALADFLAQDPDHETYVFRRFKRLAVRNVLHLQGELTALEEEVETLEREAAKSDDPEVHLSMRSWKTLDENAQRPGRDTSLEHRLRGVMSRLDGELKTYCSAHAPARHCDARVSESQGASGAARMAARLFTHVEQVVEA